MFQNIIFFKLSFVVTLESFMKSRKRNSTQFFTSFFFSHSACKVHASTLVFNKIIHCFFFFIYWPTVHLLVHVFYAFSNNDSISYCFLWSHFFSMTVFSIRFFGTFLVVYRYGCMACMHILDIYEYMYIFTHTCFQLILETDNCIRGGNHI